jgi:ADP-ribose pyrophosphatase YjhB (NUDIX family)
MPDNMVCFEKNNARFLLCVRGIVINQERVLLFNVIGWDWWALPGGRVEMLEYSNEALKREMREEIATDIKVGRLVWVVENFFKPENKPYHEIGIYYLMDLPGDSIVFKADEYTCQDGPVKLRFRWFPVAEITHVEIRPSFLKQRLLYLPAFPEQICWNDE